MLISLQEAAGFIHEHHVVFDELWHRREDPLTDVELLAIVSSAQSKVGPSYLVSQLKKLRFLVEADAHPGAWELAPAFARWLEHLQQLARPVSSAIVAGQLNALEHFLAAFRAAHAKSDWSEGREVLGDARRCLQQLTEALYQTRSAIAAVVSDVKSEHRTQSARERFRRINKLWSDYLIPMLELLDPSGNLEVICAGWERQLTLSLEQGFLPDRRLAERLEREMQVLRVSLRQSFRECRNELEPLHASLRRDSLWAEGAARLLARVEREGTSGVYLATRLPLSTFRISGQITPAALEASAARWRDISAPVEAIDFSGSGTPTDARALEEMLAAIEQSSSEVFPIDDLMAWLSREYSPSGFYPLLQIFSLLVTDTRYVATFNEPVADYSLAEGVVRSGRVKLELREIP